MKRIIYSIFAVAIMTALTLSCSKTDNPVDTGKGQVTITVNTADLYSQLGITDDMKAEIAENDIFVYDSVLIYDSKGRLVTKTGSELRELKPQTFVIDNLPNGTYTLVAWQSGDWSEEKCWEVLDEENLSTVKLITPYSGIPFFSAVGYEAVRFTVDGGNSVITTAPKSIGSIVDYTFDNYDSAMGYKEVNVCLSNEQSYDGRYLDPDRTEEDSWLPYSDKVDVDVIGTMDSYYTKYFTLAHGDNLKLTVTDSWPDTNPDTHPDTLTTALNLRLQPGENSVFYLDLKRLSWQPLFLGSPQAFAAWKADRDAGKLVFAPYMKFGCNIDEIRAYNRTRTLTRDFFDSLEVNPWPPYCWVNICQVAPELTEVYFFETEDGQRLRCVLCTAAQQIVPFEVGMKSLLPADYVYKGNFIEDDVTFEVYLSPDGLTEAMTCIDQDFWDISFQPTDPNDLQKIVSGVRPIYRSPKMTK